MKHIKLFEQFKEYTVDGKKIVWDNEEYQIAISSTENPSRISLWVHDNNIGNLYLSSITNLDGETYHKVSSVEIDKNYRGKGLSKALYNVALRYITSDGIISYLPDRVNKTQVPKIYKSLGGFIKDDYAIIPKEKKKKSDLIFKDFNEIANKYDVKPILIRTLMDEIKYEYNINRRSLKSLNSNLISELDYSIKYEDRKPRDYGYGRRKQFQEDLIKIKDITLNDFLIL